MGKIKFTEDLGIVRKLVGGRLTYVVDTVQVKNYREALEMIREDAGRRGALRKYLGVEVQLTGDGQKEFMEAYRSVRDWISQNDETSRQLRTMNEEDMLTSGKGGLFGLRNLIDDIFYRMERKECQDEFPLGLRAREMHMVGVALSPSDYSLSARVLQD